MDFKLATPFLEAFEELNKLDESALKTWRISYYEDEVKKSFTVQAASKEEAEQIGWSRVAADSLYVSEVVNEAIEDIDLEALTAAEDEVDSLSKEVTDLRREYSNKVYTAVNSDEAYAKLRAELSDLDRQLRQLRSTYEIRQWYQMGIDDWQHDDWIDEEAYEKVKDRVAELKADIEKLEAELSGLRTKLAGQFSADAAALKDKEARIAQQRARSKELRKQITQSYAEVEADVKAVVEFLNAETAEGWDEPIVWRPDPASLAYDKKGRITISLYATLDGEPEFDYDDFDDYGELTSKASVRYAENLAEDAGIYPEQFADEAGLELGADKWYTIPGFAWELSSELITEVDAAPERVEYRDGDWDLRGNFSIDAFLRIGKKVR